MNTESKPMYGWNDLPWKQFERQVFKLQKRIYRASQRGDMKTVHKLQRLLMNSWSAKCLAVRLTMTHKFRENGHDCQDEHQQQNACQRQTTASAASPPT